MKLTVQVKGIDTLTLKVKYLIDGAAKGLKFGVEEAAGLIEGAAKDLVPVDTGRLQNAIHTEETINTREVQRRTITPVVEAANPYGFDPPYARRIEYGFVGQDKLGRHYNQPAQPYMRPAGDTQAGPAREAIRNSLIEELDAAAAAVAIRRARR